MQCEYIYKKHFYGRDGVSFLELHYSYNTCNWICALHVHFDMLYTGYYTTAISSVPYSFA